MNDTDEYAALEIRREALHHVVKIVIATISAVGSDFFPDGDRIVREAKVMETYLKGKSK